jgi:hypothetical protein
MADVRGFVVDEPVEDQLVSASAAGAYLDLGSSGN